MAFPWEEGKGLILPHVFKLHDPFPGEPPFMKLRRMPAVLQFHKYKVEKDPDAYWFSEAMLYMPHDNEEDLVLQIKEAKSNGPDAWKEFVDKIAHVKSQVMDSWKIMRRQE